MASRKRLTISHLPNAEKLIGRRFTTEERRLMIQNLNEQLAAYEKLRA